MSAGARSGALLAFAAALLLLQAVPAQASDAAVRATVYRLNATAPWNASWVFPHAVTGDFACRANGRIYYLHGTAYTSGDRHTWGPANWEQLSSGYSCAENSDPTAATPGTHYVRLSNPRGARSGPGNYWAKESGQWVFKGVLTGWNGSDLQHDNSGAPPVESGFNFSVYLNHKKQVIDIGGEYCRTHGPGLALHRQGTEIFLSRRRAESGDGFRQLVAYQMSKRRCETRIVWADADLLPETTYEYKVVHVREWKTANPADGYAEGAEAIGMVTTAALGPSEPEGSSFKNWWVTKAPWNDTQVKGGGQTGDFACRNAPGQPGHGRIYYLRDGAQRATPASWDEPWKHGHACDKGNPRLRRDTDSYVNGQTGDYWQKESGQWVKKGTLTGWDESSKAFLHDGSGAPDPDPSSPDRAVRIWGVAKAPWNDRHVRESGQTGDFACRNAPGQAEHGRLYYLREGAQRDHTNWDEPWRNGHFCARGGPEGTEARKISDTRRWSDSYVDTSSLDYWRFESNQWVKKGKLTGYANGELQHGDNSGAPPPESPMVAVWHASGLNKAPWNVPTIQANAQMGDFACRNAANRFYYLRGPGFDDYPGGDKHRWGDDEWDMVHRDGHFCARGGPEGTEARKISDTRRWSDSYVDTSSLDYWRPSSPQSRQKAAGAGAGGGGCAGGGARGGDNLPGDAAGRQRERGAGIVSEHGAGGPGLQGSERNTDLRAG